MQHGKLEYAFQNRCACLNCTHALARWYHRESPGRQTYFRLHNRTLYKAVKAYLLCEPPGRWRDAVARSKSQPPQDEECWLCRVYTSGFLCDFCAFNRVDLMWSRDGDELSIRPAFANLL